MTCNRCLARMLCIAWLAMFICTKHVRAQSGTASVAVSPLIEREIAVTQTFVGTVMPLRKAIIGSAVDGRVVTFPRNAGDRVEEGETLAQLLTDTIRLEWATADAELKLRQEQLAELSNGSRPEELEQARARMLGAEATMKYQQARRVRAEAMYANNRAVSEEERDLAVSASIAAEQAFAESVHAYQMSKKGPREEQIAQARAQVAMQQAAADRLADLVKKHTIISHFSGYVTAEHTEVGQWVKQGDPVVEVVALDDVEITTYVVEQYVPYSRVGMTVNVEVPAFPQRQFAGRISAVVPQADVQARTFPVQVRVKNEVIENEPLLKAGMYARVTLPTGRRETGLLISKDALVLGGTRPVIYVVTPAADDKQGKARPVAVETGQSIGGLIQVTGPLSPGQMIAVKGNEGLQPLEQDVRIDSVIPPPNLSGQSAVSQTDGR
jgi:HlyD family secretion protein